MKKQRIKWTTFTWNPPACKFSYAALFAKSRLSHLPEFKDGYFGNVKLHPKRLEYPLHWRQPKMIFVNSMSDMFHEKVPDEFIQEMFAVMVLCPQHKFQILSKREERTADWFNQTYFGLTQEEIIKQLCESKYKIEFVPLGKEINNKNQRHWPGWPLQNVWLGFSVENEKYAQKRIPVLAKIPAAVRWVSYEPVLGPVNWEPYKKILNWLVSGTESGPKARPAHPDWHRQARDFCIKNKIPYFFKQHGCWLPTDEACGYDGKGSRKYAQYTASGSWVYSNKINSSTLTLAKMNKKRAGRLLDGRTWDEYPE